MNSLVVQKWLVTSKPVAEHGFLLKLDAQNNQVLRYHQFHILGKVCSRTI